MESDVCRLTCPPYIAWSVEIEGVYLINRRTGTTRKLSEPDAAVWDLLSRGYTPEKIIGLIGFISAQSYRDAKVLVVELLHSLCHEGFLRLEEEDLHG